MSSSSHAVVYICTASHLFQTMVSAGQARLNVDQLASVIVIVVGEPEQSVPDPFRSMAQDLGVVVLRRTYADIDELPLVYARLFLDRLLPDFPEELLYIDGDTQIDGDLEPLLRARPPVRGLIAAPDPMLLYRYSTRRLGRRIDGWFDQSRLDVSARLRYVNCGVLRFDKKYVESIRADALGFRAKASGRLVFEDQDAINGGLHERIALMPLLWNFPAFLLGHPDAVRGQPKIVHFMSSPRPWEAPYQPWGMTRYKPYEDVVSLYPALRPYWVRHSLIERLRYTVQQKSKRVVEQRFLQTDRGREKLIELASLATELLEDGT